MSLRIKKFKEIDSTNEYAKKLVFENNSTRYIISDSQSKGKGRDGRSFVSNEGGIFLSIVKDMEELPRNTSLITGVAGAAVSKALDKLMIITFIKWPNDIILNKKKLSGILTECVNIEKKFRIIIGIGLNVNNDISAIDIATSLQKEEINIDKDLLTSEIIRNFEELYEKFLQNDLEEILDILNKKSYVVGKRISVIKNLKKIELEALKVKSDGSLKVKYKSGEIEDIYAGEISIINSIL